ncbi:MAG: DUF5103 domain-containing protein, partial [Flavobacteriales bacterium]
MKAFNIITFALFFTFSVYSQKNEYYSAQIKYKDHIYKDSIKTVRLHRKGWEMSPPALELNSEQKLRLSFDRLGNTIKNFRYTFLHCNANWKPSDLIKADYLNGFFDDDISDYRYSVATQQNYIHYVARFPNQNTSFKKTGNYILKVFLDNENKELILTKRFMVFENKVNLKTQTFKSRKVSSRETSREIKVKAMNSEDFQNPSGNLKLTLTQNNRWDNAYIGLKPTFIRSGEIIFDNKREIAFKGGNEYRKFNTKSLRYKGDEVKRISSNKNGYEVFLLPDEIRKFKGHFSNNRDINGQYIVRNQDANTDEDEINADYVKVHFRLKHDKPLPNGDLYVFGALSGWDFKKEFRLDYYKK